MVRNAPQIGRDGFSVEESIFTLLRVACWDLDQTLSLAGPPTPRWLTAWLWPIPKGSS